MKKNGDNMGRLENSDEKIETQDEATSEPQLIDTTNETTSDTTNDTTEDSTEQKPEQKIQKHKKDIKTLPIRDIKIDKVVVNIGVGEAGDKLIKAEKVLGLLTHCKPVRTISHTTNRDLGIRKLMPIGCKVTLRKNKMYEFFDRLVNIALPLVRDFKGVSGKSFGGGICRWR